jgi:hypothetical protein
MIAVFTTAAVILGVAAAIINLGASRVFWMLLGFHLGRRKGKRVQR